MRAFLFWALLFLGSAAIAAETVTYTYDARGRLIAVAHSGGPNTGLTTNYTLDPADNRTAKTTGTGGGATCAGISFTIASNGAVTEGTNSVFTVTKAGSTTNSCSVSYATANGTAVAGTNYTAKSGTLTFTSAQSSQTVSVTTINTQFTGSKTFSMSLSNPTGGSMLGTPSSATATINGSGATNNPPVANFDNAGSMTCGDTMTYNVVANDTDPDGDYPLSLVSASGSPGIIVSVFSSTSVQIQSTGLSSGTKGFTYVVQDSRGAQANGSGSVTVLAPCQ